MIAQKDFDALCRSAALPQATELYDRLSVYCAMLQDWNERMNLTAITDDEGVAEKHFVDSLLPLALCDVPRETSLIDVGTGAGFPGIPMKLLREDIRLTLLDPLEKRLRFLREVCAALGISAETLHLRGEQAGQDAHYRESYDIATSRAVAQLGLLAEYCLPLLKPSGMMLALKGQYSEAELSEAKPAIRLCGGETESVKRYQLPGGDERTLIIVRKISRTPPKYPRPTAKIGKQPLK